MKKYGINKKVTVTLELYLTEKEKTEHVQEHIFDCLYTNRRDNRGIIGMKIDCVKEEEFSDEKWRREQDLFSQRLMRGLYLEGGI